MHDEVSRALEHGKYHNDRDWYKLLQNPRNGPELVDSAFVEEHVDEIGQNVKHFGIEGMPTSKDLQKTRSRPESKEDGAEADGDERQDAKFEASYDDATNE